MVGVLFLPNQFAARCVDIPEVGSAVSAFIHFDAGQLFVFVELDTLGLLLSLRFGDPARTLSVRVFDCDLEVPVVVFIEFFDLDSAFRVERVPDIRLAVGVAILGLFRLLSVAEFDHRVVAAVSGGVGLSVDWRIAVYDGDDVGFAGPVAILFFAYAFSGRVETKQIGFAVSGAVDLLALHLPVDVEVDHAFWLSVAVLVLNLRALDAVLVAGDPIEVAIAGGIRLLLRDHARLEEGHDILLSVAGRVFLELLP